MMVINMYEHNGYIMLEFYDGDKRIRIREHRLNILINNSLNDVLNNQVHHKNCCKLDNRVENLELINPSKHSSLHDIGNKYKFNSCIIIRREKGKSYKQGFRWVAKPCTNDNYKGKTLSSVDLNICIKKVEEFINSPENTYGYTSYEIKED